MKDDFQNGRDCAREDLDNGNSRESLGIGNAAFSFFEGIFGGDTSFNDGYQSVLDEED